MYIGTAILRRFKAEGSRKEDVPFVHFTMNHCFFEIQKAFDGIFNNLEVPLIAWLFRGPVRWWGNLNSLAGEDNDAHTHKIATLMMTDSEQRNRLTDGIYIPTNMNEALARLEEAFRVTKRAENAEEKMRAAVRKKILPKIKGRDLIKAALDKEIITLDEQNDLLRSEELRHACIQVDDFSESEYHASSVGTTKSPPGKTPGWDGPKAAKVI
jgi:acyl-CoA dehydrogenase